MIKERIKMKICIVITIWQGITIQGLYCDLDMGNDTVMYYKCSHVPNLLIYPEREKIEACHYGSS